MTNDEPIETDVSVDTKASFVLEVAANRIAADPVLAKSVAIEGVNETKVTVTINFLDKNGKRWKRNRSSGS